MSWPQATRQDHETFCQVEGWRRVRDARSRAGTHHITYKLEMKDGRVLRTRISHPVDRRAYGPSIWSHILRDQLGVSQEEFWACVRDRKTPDRGVPVPPSTALPADLVYLLMARVGLAEGDIATMTKDEALARLQSYWDEGP